MTAGDPVRAFIAVFIPDSIRRTLAAIQDTLRAADTGVSWARPEHIHLTLHFLGSVESAVLPRLADGINAAAGSVRPFELAVRGLGTFGSPRRPRVIWAGLRLPPPELEQLHDALGVAVRAVGMATEERPFRPHLTLGRVRDARNLGELTSRIRSVKNSESGLFRVRHVRLMQSHLDKPGPRYSVLHEAPLKGLTDGQSEEEGRTENHG